MAIPAVNPICSTHCSSKQKFKCAVAVEDPPTTPTKKNKKTKKHLQKEMEMKYHVCVERANCPPAALFLSSPPLFSDLVSPPEGGATLLLSLPPKSVLSCFSPAWLVLIAQC